MQGSRKNRLPRRSALLVASLVAIVASLAVTGVASATTVNGGTTTLEIKKGTKKLLKAAGVKVKPTGDATKAGRTFTFPITAGSLDRGTEYSQPTSASGNVQHDSGLKFKCKGGKVTVDDLVATFGAASDLTGTSKGSLLKLADLITTNAVVTDRGADIANVKAKAAKKFAKKLRKACDVNLKRKTLGLMHVDAQASLAVLSGETSLTTTVDFAVHLFMVDAGAEPIAPATVTPGPGPGGVPPTFTFPVTGGELNQDTFVGTIEHDGGLLIEEPDTEAPPHSATTEDPFVELAGPAGGTLTMFSVNLQSRAGLFDVAITGTPSITDGKLTADASLTLTAGAAALLNSDFVDAGEPPFAAGEAVGAGVISANVG